jgi:hypothetical protein
MNVDGLTSGFMCQSPYLKKAKVPAGDVSRISVGGSALAGENIQAGGVEPFTGKMM